MRTVFLFTRRSIQLFLRDKATVFFSFLSTLIILALYFLFIGKSYADGMSETLGGLLSADETYSIVYIQMIVGVLVLDSLSLSIGAFTTIAYDFENRRVDSFLLTPIKSSQLLVAYFSGGFIVSFILNVFTWLAQYPCNRSRFWLLGKYRYNTDCNRHIDFCIGDKLYADAVIHGFGQIEFSHRRIQRSSRNLLWIPVRNIYAL